MGRFGEVLKRAGIHSEAAMPMASERYEGLEAFYAWISLLLRWSGAALLSMMASLIPFPGTDSFFLGGTSQKCASYHSETLYKKLGITSPHSLHPLPPS